MARPCKCGKAIIGPRSSDQCILCWKYLNSPAFAQHWDAQSSGHKSRAKVSLPCIHLSDDEITGFEREKNNLAHNRLWRKCGLKHGLNGYVCGCLAWPSGGCYGCPDYVPKVPDGVFPNADTKE